MDPASYTPLFVPVGDPSLEDVLREQRIQEKNDCFAEQVEELYEILEPAASRQKDANHFADFQKEQFGPDPDKAGTWVIYPWLYRAVRLLPAEQFHRVRTARNQNIITREEQQRFMQGTVGIAGLSVGSSIANILALVSGPRLRIADFDTLALSNLNRLNNSVTGLGVNKAVLCARRIYELNPYAQIEVFTDGLTEENIDRFTDGLNVLFDEIDNLKIKIDLRLHARGSKIPVIMVTDDADNILIDIERYDQGVTTLFHGRLEEEEAQALFAAPSIDPPTRIKMAMKIIGAENSVPRMQQSLLEIGRTLASVPQLGTAVSLTGAAGAYIARKIILDEPLFAGRTHFSLDATLIPDYLSDANTAERQKQTEAFVNTLNSL